MAGMDVEALVHPLGEAAPCGTDLEDTQQMAAIDAFRVFGQDRPLNTDTDWRAINAAALEALGTSRDFRLLAHVAAAQLRLTGLQPFVDSLRVAAHWLEDYFDDVFPRIDDDAVLRKNALNYFADRMAVVDALRRIPLVSNRQLGSFSLRHVAIAAGQQAPDAEDAGSPPTEAMINGAFTAAPPEELVQLVASIDAGLSALKTIESAMVAKQGVQAAPDTGPVSGVLVRMREIVAKHAPVPVVESSAEEAADAETTPAGGVPGQIRTREDAVRSLDAVAEFFRRSEPSSPVPMFVERAKRLVSRNFLEVLAELAPDSVAAVKHVGGIRDES
jgi:type VI secretion system protein ImpA